MLSWRRDKKEDAGAPSAPDPVATRPEPAPVNNASPPVANHPRLGELLVHEGVITSAQLHEALQKQRQTGAFLGQTLVELGYLSQSTLVSFLVKQCKIPHISLLDYNIGEDLFKLVPKHLCHQYRLLPIDKLGKILTLAMVDPLDAVALAKVRELCPDLKIKPILCTWNHFEQIARKLFTEIPQQPAEVTMGTFGLAPRKPVEKALAESENKSQANKAVAELVQQVGTQRPPSASPSPPINAPRPQPAVPPAQAAHSEPHAAPRIQVPEAIFDRVGDRVREALTESLTPLIAEQQKLIALQLESARGKPGELAKEIAAGMKTTLLEGIAPLIEAHAVRADTAAPSPIDPGAFAKELGESVRAAMLDAVLPALQANGPKEEVRAETPALDPMTMADHFGAHIDRSMASLAKEFRDASATQNDRIAELADTTKHALVALREALDSMRPPAPPAEEAVVSNVAPFPGLRASEPSQAAAMAPPDPMEEIGLGAETDDRVREALLTGRLQRGYRFDTFLSGGANAFTLSVAHAIAEKSSREFTPFYIYGDVGVGKTHIVHAIGNAIAARDPDLRVLYMTGLRFVSACERAARDQDLEKFRESFAHWDVLLFDDVQSVAAHKQAQDELRALLGELTTEGRLIVAGADRAPDQLPETSHQLTSRLAAGIVARLHAPDMATRVAILQRHARSLRAKVGDNILSLIASRIPVDVRKMTGALRKALAYAQVAGTEVTQEMTAEILDHLTAIDAA